MQSLLIDEPGFPAYIPMGGTAPPASVPVTVEKPASPAEACASFDPVETPEALLDILEYASNETGVPKEKLYGVWRNETGVIYGSGGSDHCDVMEQLQIRCKVGGACGHESAMRSMAKRFSWDLRRMKCSCGNSTMGENNGIFGGCCGPLAFSGAEVQKLALAEDLDPMTFCGGVMILGRELKNYHDIAIASRTASGDQAAWRVAISRYYGSDDGHYYANVSRFIREMNAWTVKDQKQPGYLREQLTTYAKWSGQHLYSRPPHPKRVAQF
jgi:hypothetical protein